MTEHDTSDEVVQRAPRDTDAAADLEDLDARLRHRPEAEQLLAHLRSRYGIDRIAATKASRHSSRAAGRSTRGAPERVEDGRRRGPRSTRGVGTAPGATGRRDAMGTGRAGPGARAAGRLQAPRADHLDQLLADLCDRVSASPTSTSAFDWG